MDKQELIKLCDEFNDLSEQDSVHLFGNIIRSALENGVPKDQMIDELSCPSSTIARWAANETAPGPYGRKAIVGRIRNMLG